MENSRQNGGRPCNYCKRRIAAMALVFFALVLAAGFLVAKQYYAYNG